MIPAGKYLGGLVKSGKTAGLTAIKTSIKTTVTEGLEQGAKNLDSFKGVLKKTKGLGDNIYHSLPTYRKQLARHLQNTVDEGLLNLSRATQEGLERAKQFTLEVPTIRTTQAAPVGSANVQAFSKLDTTTVKLGDTGLGKSLDNLASKAKHVENTRLDKLRARNAFHGNKVDDVLEAGSKAGQDMSDDVARGLEEAGKKGASYPSTYDERINQTPVNNGSWTGDRGESKFISELDEVNDVLKQYDIDGIEYKDGIPDFSPVSEGEISHPDMGIDRNKNFKVADELLAKQLDVPRKEITKLRKQGKLTWHELNDMETMQLVPSVVNSKFGHLGGVAEVKKLLGL